jgi:hypothetical protein
MMASETLRLVKGGSLDVFRRLAASVPLDDGLRGGQ